MLTTLLAAALQTCVIVVPTENVIVDGQSYTPAQIERHERGHCAGMVTEHLVPPARFSRIPKGMHVEVNRLPPDVARQVCRAMGGEAYGCQTFE